MPQAFDRLLGIGGTERDQGHVVVRSERLRDSERVPVPAADEIERAREVGRHHDRHLKPGGLRSVVQQSSDNNSERRAGSAPFDRGQRRRPSSTPAGPPSTMPNPADYNRPLARNSKTEGRRFESFRPCDAAEILGR